MNKRKKYIAAGILGAACLLCAPLYSSAEDAKQSQGGGGTTQTTYMDEDGREKIIYWTDQITPPVMNGADDEDSDFKRVVDQINGSTYIEYIAPYSPGNGWYDVNKSPDQVLDKNLCFAAAASNMLHWWFDRNAVYIERYLQLYPDAPKAADIQELAQPLKDQYSSEIYARFVDQFAGRQEGFWPDLLEDQFINGYTPKKSGGVTDPDYEGADLIQNGPDSRGGFFYQVFGPDILTRRRYYDYVGSYETLSKDLQSFIAQGDIVTLTYDMGASAHVVTLWGIEYDSDGKLCGVYFSDSDDSDEQGMHRYRVINRNGIPYVTTDVRDDGAGSKVTCLTTLSVGEDAWKKITEQSRIELNLVWGNTQLVYNGTPQKPELTAWNIMQGDDVLLLAEGEQTEAGTYTAAAKLTGTEADKYRLPQESEKEFTIMQSGTVFDGGIKLYCGSEETSDYIFGETVCVKVSPRATGMLPSVQGAPLPLALPGSGQAALYSGNHLLAGPVSSDGNGSYILNGTISDDKFQTGMNTLTVKFYGDSNMADYEQSVSITVAGSDYLPVAQILPTCETAGKKAHFTDKSGKLYIEENGIKKEVTEQELILPATGHNPGNWIQKNDRHYRECLNGCGTHLDEAACSGGAAGDAEQAVCQICGHPYGKKQENPSVSPDKYEMISGADSSYACSSDKELTFRANGDFAKFTGVRVDGETVEESCYTAVSGSTVITFKPEYLNTLPAGVHTLEIDYVDGAVSCLFKIVEEEQTTQQSGESKNDLSAAVTSETDLPESISEHPVENTADDLTGDSYKSPSTDDGPGTEIAFLLCVCALTAMWFPYKKKNKRS